MAESRDIFVCRASTTLTDGTQVRVRTTALLCVFVCVCNEEGLTVGLSILVDGSCALSTLDLAGPMAFGIIWRDNYANNGGFEISGAVADVVRGPASIRTRRTDTQTHTHTHTLHLYTVTSYARTRMHICTLIQNTTAHRLLKITHSRTRTKGCSTRRTTLSGFLFETIKDYDGFLFGKKRIPLLNLHFAGIGY